MSFFNSLNKLWLKLEQKNVVLCSGNINEIIDNSSKDYKNNFDHLYNDKTQEFISVIEHVCSMAKFLDFKVIKYFSSNLGIVDYLNKNNYEYKNNSIDNNDDDFLEDNSINNHGLFNNFIDEINNIIKEIREDNKKTYRNLFILECGDIFLNNKSNIDINKLSALIQTFTEFSKQPINNFHKNKIKLLILARSPENINQVITRNNIEFTSTTLLKPDKNERESFFKKFKNKFSCLSNTCKEINHPDYNELITLTDGMSFREIFQYSKINTTIIDNPINFRQLYQLISLNKKESEWEKIDLNKMNRINEILSERVKGQDFAIEIVKKTLIRSFTGMNGVLHSTTNNKKPKGTLFLVGPTGTGKTELAKAISEFIFGDENRIIRFDMSEFNQEHSDQRLISAPPGYIGYDSGGELTNAVKDKPFSILLFDEIEKAHNKILDKFLQILEDGRLTSSKGEIIDFSETFIIFTSNIGVNEINNQLYDQNYVRNHFLKSVSNYFNNMLNRPEILNRIGIKNVIPFSFITDEKIIRKIINSKLNMLKKLLEEEKYINIHFKNNAQEKIENDVIENIDYKLGGRGVITELETKFLDKLSEFIFINFKSIKENKNQNKITKINIIYEDELKFNID